MFFLVQQFSIILYFYLQKSSSSEWEKKLLATKELAYREIKEIRKHFSILYVLVINTITKFMIPQYFLVSKTDCIYVHMYKVDTDCGVEELPLFISLFMVSCNVKAITQN